VTLGTSAGDRVIYAIAAIPLLISIAVAVVVWRNARREQAAQALRLRLANPDPEVRRRALDEVTDDVLSAHAALLCELLAVEEDPEVLDALAAAVARSRWEPTNDVALAELRRWVAGGQSRATRASSRRAAGDEPGPDASGEASGVAAPAATVARDAAHAPPVDLDATDATRSGGAAVARDAGDGAPTDEELAALVPKVREVLGGDLDRLELVSIEGQVLARWPSDEPGGGGAADGGR
jgi:hypothetical protein